MGILGLIGAGIGLGSSIFGGIKAARAARDQKEAIDRMNADNEAWYNRNYYANYMDSTEARAAMKRVEDTLRRRSQQTSAQAAVSGATPEQVVAQQQADSRVVGDVATNLASQSTAIKRQVDAQNQANKNAINRMRMEQMALDESGAGAAMQSGINLIGNSLNGFDGKNPFKKKGATQ